MWREIAEIKGQRTHLELIHVAIHPSSRRGSEGTARVALRGLCGSRVVNRVVEEVLGHGFPFLQPLLDLGVSDIARHNERSGEAEACADGVLGQDGSDVLHGLVQIHFHHVLVLQLLLRHLKSGSGICTTGQSNL